MMTFKIATCGGNILMKYSIRNYVYRSGTTPFTEEASYFLDLTKNFIFS